MVSQRASSLVALIQVLVMKAQKTTQQCQWVNPVSKIYSCPYYTLIATLKFLLLVTRLHKKPLTTINSHSKILHTCCKMHATSISRQLTFINYPKVLVQRNISTSSTAIYNMAVAAVVVECGHTNINTALAVLGAHFTPPLVDKTDTQRIHLLRKFQTNYRQFIWLTSNCTECLRHLCNSIRRIAATFVSLQYKFVLANELKKQESFHEYYTKLKKRLRFGRRITYKIN